MRPVVSVLLGLMLASAADAKPSSRRPTDLDRGEELYLRHCVACHGATNRGDGPATEALVQPVPDLVGSVESDTKTQQLVLKGRTTMPAFEASFDIRDARRVLLYMAEAHIKGKAAPHNEDEDDGDTVDDDDEQEEPALDGQAPPDAPTED